LTGLVRLNQSEIQLFHIRDGDAANYCSVIKRTTSVADEKCFGVISTQLF